MPDLPRGGSREASTNTVIRSAHEKDDEQDVDAPPLEVLPERIKEMDQLIDEEVKEYVDASKGLDTLVEEQVSRACEK